MLYSDIGGVLGTNGWDEDVRDNICHQFGLAPDEILGRHRLMFDTYERGYMSFEEYLRHVFFGTPRSFTLAQVREAAFAQSVAWPENLAFLRHVKEKNALKVGLISNEGAGITEHRVGKFNLRELADFMVISHFVHMRKPDPGIWNLALNLTQSRPEEAVYIDDRPMFVQVAAELGFTAICHTSLRQTAAELKSLGLQVED